MKRKTVFAVLAATFATCLVVTGSCFSQEIPKPGTTIDKNNYKKYAHLFPEEFLPIFENGFGLLTPIHMNVVATKPASVPKEFLDLSAKNKGKYGIDAQGNVTGGYQREGLPFPDLQRNDKDFATKLMWNFDCRYYADEMDQNLSQSFEKRKGEAVRENIARIIFVWYKGRLVATPKPDLPNPIGLYKTQLVHWAAPDSMKNTMNLSYRYVDVKKPDETYLFLPSMRRTLRAEAGQRSTPLLGSTAALDDLGGFDGRVPEFTYTIVGEQKVLAITDNKVTRESALNMAKTTLPFPYDNYEVRDTYVIDIKPKNPRYPQGRKRIWLDKETCSHVFYTVAFDRAGKAWKVWAFAFRRHPVLGNQYPVADGPFGIDLQFGMANYSVTNATVNNRNYTYNEFTPAALLRRGR
jgi:hypothetical protein